MLLYCGCQGTAQYPGVAKFGIALEWGSRGRWFESSHSDQKRGNCYGFLSFLCFEQRTSGLLLRRQAHFNLPHGNAVRSTAFPTGSNPVTRTTKSVLRKQDGFCHNVPKAHITSWRNHFMSAGHFILRKQYFIHTRERKLIWFPLFFFYEQCQRRIPAPMGAFAYSPQDFCFSSSNWLSLSVLRRVML